MTAKSTSFQEHGPAKKPYEIPRLEVYGDIREITHTAGMMSHTPDGAAHGMDKTN